MSMSEAPASGPAASGPAQPVATLTPALSSDDIRLLTEIGFLAAGRGDVAHADTIFQALRRLRPGRAFPCIGLALCRLNAGRAQEAVRLLEQAHSPDAQEQALLDAWRGFALQLAGLAGQSRALLGAVAQGPDGEAAQLARALLGQAAHSTDNSSNIETSLVTGN